MATAKCSSVVMMSVNSCDVPVPFSVREEGGGELTLKKEISLLKGKEIKCFFKYILRDNFLLSQTVNTHR